MVNVVPTGELLMAFVRVKRRGEKDYYYLVESYRTGKKVKQTCLLYLGTKKPPSDEMDKILNDIIKRKNSRIK